MVVYLLRVDFRTQASCRVFILCVRGSLMGVSDKIGHLLLFIDNYVIVKVKL